MSPLQPDAGTGSSASPDEPERLVGITPSQVASFIRGLRGRLTHLDGDTVGSEQHVVYTFEVAGRRQSFRAPVRGGVVESIAHLFPEAAEREAKLHDQLGIEFRRLPDP